MKISIHQPNFFPHKAFFDKMRESDLFVILTHCQYEKNGYQNRFKYNRVWYTMSTNKGMEPISFKRYVNYKKDWAFIKNKLQIKELDLYDSLIGPFLQMTNISIIIRIAQLLGIETRIELDEETKLTGTARLVEICKKHKADTYLSGPSGKEYIDKKLFDETNINVEYQEITRTRPILKVLYGR